MNNDHDMRTNIKLGSLPVFSSTMKISLLTLLLCDQYDQLKKLFKVDHATPLKKQNICLGFS